MLPFFCLYIVGLHVLENLYLLPRYGAWTSDFFSIKKGKQKTVLVNVK